MDSGKRPPLDEHKALFEATLAAEGVTTGAGEATGLSLVDAKLAGAGANSFVSMMAIIHPGDPQQVDSKDVTAFNDGTGAVTVASAFKGGQVLAGVPYKIVTFRFTPAEVAALAVAVAAIEAKLDALSGPTGVFYEQESEPIEEDAILASATDVVHLLGGRFIVRSLRLKCEDPGVNTVIVRLREFINNGLTIVDSFVITGANFDKYHSLMDMFGLPHLAGDQIIVSVQATGGGPYTITGQYSQGRTSA